MEVNLKEYSSILRRKKYNLGKKLLEKCEKIVVPS